MTFSRIFATLAVICLTAIAAFALRAVVTAPAAAGGYDALSQQREGEWSSEQYENWGFGLYEEHWDEMIASAGDRITQIKMSNVSVQNPAVSSPPDNLDPGSLRRQALIKLNDADNVGQVGGLRRYPSLVHDEPVGPHTHRTGVLRK